MSSSVQIVGPDTIVLLAGVPIDGLTLAAPGGLALIDVNAGSSISVTLTSGASLSASSAGGANVVSGAGSMTLSGSLAEVNAALASLLISSTTAGISTLAITAQDGSVTTTTTLGVDVLADSAPAFVSPASNLALTAAVATNLGLTLADDPALALALLGAPAEQLQVTLVASSGALLLDPAIAAGVGVTGDATGAITLSATSTEFGALAAALEAVSLETGSGGTVEYIASQVGGPLPLTDTSGSFSYSASGTIASSSESWTGSAVDWQAPGAWSGAHTPDLGTNVTFGTGTTVQGFGVAASLTVSAGAAVDFEAQLGVADVNFGSASVDMLGGAAVSVANTAVLGASTLLIGADASFAAGAITIGAGGSMIDFGSVTLGGAEVIGDALLPGGGALGGVLAVGSGGLIDFAGTLQSDLAATNTGIVAITLASGAMIAGAGTLVAGNFSESNNIAGPGTVIALGPAPLEILAGSIGGGAHFVIDPGASLEFGAIAPLFGVFNASPVTIGTDATIAFAPGASPGQDGTGYASALGEQGGVLVLDNPESFSGTIIGFLPGDRIDFATLTSLSVFNVSSSGFEVQGVAVGNTTQSEIITIHTSLATGLNPAIETDAAGGQVIGVRAGSAALTLNDTAASSAVINAVNAVATPIEGLGLLVPSNGSAGLVLTISASHGTIADGGAGTTALTLSAATALSLNAELAALVYTAPATGTGDVLDFTGGTGLAGLHAAIGVNVAAAATLSFSGGNTAAFNADSAWQGTVAPAVGDLAVFASHAGAPVLVTGPGAASAISIAGGYDFAGVFDLAGSAGTALAIGSDGFALFNANAVVTLAAGVMVGDGTGAGTLGVAGTVYAAADAMVIGGAANAAGSMLEITGNLLLAQSLALGGGAAATLEITGDAGFSTTTLGGTTNGAHGLIRADRTATLGLGTLEIVSGSILIGGAATVSVGAATMVAGTINVTGAGQFIGDFGLDLVGGGLTIGAEAAASLVPGTLTIGAAATLDLAGSMSAASIIDAGQASITGGKALVSGAISLSGSAALDLSGATLAAGAITMSTNASLIGNGVIEAAATGVALTTIDAAGVLEATGGTLTLGGDLLGNATIGSGAMLALIAGASGGTIGFAGTGAVLATNDVAQMQDAVANLTSGDAIDLIGVAPSLVSVSGGFIHVGSQTEFALNEANGAPAASVASDGHGGTYITAGGSMPCFVRGTHLLTPSGYRPVEDLIPGDPLVTQDGVAHAIRWIGWRTIDLARDPAASLLRSVVIAPGAFGPGRPLRKLRVSPLHAVFGSGALLPAVLLVNNATITRDEGAFAVTYYHVELDHHAVVFAEGLQTETYRDTGNRDRFIAQIGMPCGYIAACAPLVLGGAQLRDARTALHQRATSLGYKIVHGPEAVISTGAVGNPIMPRVRGRRMVFDLPVPAERLTLICRTGMASDTDPTSEDRRLLGLCVGDLRANGRSVKSYRGDGWHTTARGDRGEWSTGVASVQLPAPAHRVSFDVLGSIPRWVRDPAYIAA